MCDQHGFCIERLLIQEKIVQYSLNYLNEKYGADKFKNNHLDNLIERLQIDLNFFQHDFKKHKSSSENTLGNYQRIYLELLENQRRLLNTMNSHTEFDEDVIRKYLSLIDLEEYKLREKLL